MQLISLSKNNEFFKNKYLSFTKTKIAEDGSLLKWTKMVLPLEWTDYNLVKLTYSEKRHFNKNDGSWRHSEYARKLHFSKNFSKTFISEN